ncbi:NAD(P)H-hydrate dehydratase [uncultured Veillonella sp.]|uniref:NAD(P)H-hydrate dehydratase n=1 Tax=uncultured Veillonella sp. TaxID=159268 RepID=UPI0025ECB1AD|nr:NAD(P)H-hydrate dehydratase [uncultured Veillonella sp.]MDY3973049.1 NAD(P)H-hydrate dehydratase [Veillonella caviae]
MRILTSKEAQFIDSWAETKGHLPTSLLMENAGHGVAQVIAEELKKRFKELHKEQEILILAGFGNNGADGLVAARHLDAWGYEVRVLTPNSGGSESELFTMQKEIVDSLDIPVLSLADGVDIIEGATVIVDALIGTSLQGPLRQPMLDLLDAVEAYLDIYKDTLVIAVDMPSGVHPDTGDVANGTLGVDITITFGAPKQGMYLYPAREYCGDIIIKGLGFNWELALYDETNESFPTELIDDELASALIPEREATAHKGTNGHVLIIGGAAGMIGAPVMATEGALRAGAGKVTAIVPTDCLSAMQAKVRPEIMTGAFSNLIHLRMHGGEKNAIVIGPGLGRNEEISTLAKNFMAQTTAPLVIDADALWAIGNMLTFSESLKGKPVPPILTPHPGEFSRLTGKSVEEIEAQRVELARQFAIQHQVVLVLKGAPTVVTSPDGFVAINKSGNPGMGSGGMGDVLAGIIAGFLGQGLEAVEAAMLAVYLHGKSADTLNEARLFGYTATEVAEQLPYEISKL